MPLEMMRRCEWTGWVRTAGTVDRNERQSKQADYDHQVKLPILPQAIGDSRLTGGQAGYAQMMRDIIRTCIPDRHWRYADGWIRRRRSRPCRCWPWSFFYK